MNFYVYIYKNPLKDLEPFYVGKGQADRKIYHLFESHLKDDPNRHKVNTIRKILRANLQPIIEIVSEHTDEQEVFDAEIKLIKHIGRADLGLGPLTNMTDGGEGTTNKIITDEYRKKLSEGTKRAYANGRAVITDAFRFSRKGVKDTEETVRKRIEARKDYRPTESTKRKIGRSNKISHNTQAYRDKASTSQRGKIHTYEHTLKSIIGNPHSQPIEILGIKYFSIGQAIKTTGLTPGKVRKHPTLRYL